MTTHALPTGIWKLDPDSTTITTSLKKLGFIAVSATLTLVEGTVMVATSDEGELGGSVQIQVDAGSYKSASAIRDKQVLGTNFLDAVNHPTFQFTGTSMEPTSSGYLVTGDAVVKGSTTQIHFDVTNIAASGNTASFTATTTVQRKALGVDAMPTFIIGDDVEVTVTAKATLH